MTRAFSPCQGLEHGLRALVTGNLLSYLCLSTAICGSLVGCVPRDRVGPAGYFGRTEPLSVVVAAINANNQPLETLRTTGHFKARFKEDSKTHSVDGEITILFSRPRSMRMRATNLAVGEVFDIGSNDDRYWATVRPQDAFYWGSWDRVDQVDRSRVPIPPDLLLEVMPVQVLPTNLLLDPSPVLTFNNDADAYVISWQTLLSDRWIVRKQVWYDRTTFLPMNVLLFDAHGKVLLRAYLSAHKPVEAPDIARDQWPRVATKYDLFFTETGSSMVLTLDRDLALKGGRPPAPNERSFIFPREPSVMHEIPLDAPTTREGR